jgi:cytochrome c-type biogenesis protein CcmH/NrfG
MSNLSDANRLKSFWSSLLNRTGFSYAILLLLTAILYAPTVRFDYNLDDELVTRNHPRTSLGLHGIWEILRSPYFEDREMGYAYEYRPVTHISFALEHTLFGESPATSHAINVLLYGLTGILLLIFLRELEPDSPVPLLAAVLFMIHPIHVEVVSSIKNREEILALIGGLGAAIGCVRFIRSEKMLYLLLMSLCFAIGFYSKKSIASFAVALPFMVSVFSQAPRKHLLSVAVPIAVIVSMSINVDGQYRWFTTILTIMASVIVSHVAVNEGRLLSVLSAKRHSLQQEVMRIMKLSAVRANSLLRSGISSIHHWYTLSEELLLARLERLNPELTIAPGPKDRFKLSAREITVSVLSLSIGAAVNEFSPLKMSLQERMALSSAISFIPLFVLRGNGFVAALLLWSLFAWYSGFLFVHGHNMAGPVAMVLILYCVGGRLMLNLLSGILICSISPETINNFVMAFAFGFFHIHNKERLRLNWSWGIPVFGIAIPLLNLMKGDGITALLSFIPLVWLFWITFSKMNENSAIISIRVLIGAFIVFSLFVQDHDFAQESFSLTDIGTAFASESTLVNTDGKFIHAQLLNLPVTDSNDAESSQLRPYNFLEFPVGFNPSPDKRLGTAATILGHYLKMMVLPWPQNFYYGFDLVPVVGMRDGRALSSALIHLVLLFVCIYAGRRYPFLSAGLMIYLASVFIFSNLVSPVAGMIADRLTYVASLGFCMVAAYLMHRLYLLTPSSVRPIMMAALLTLCSVSCYAVFKRASLWSDPITLMRHDLARDGRSAQGHNLLAFQLMSKSLDSKNANERLELQKEAISHFRKAISIYPYLANFWYDLGRAYLTIGDEQRAFTSFKQAFDRDPSFPDSGIEAAILAFSTGRSDDATEILQKIVALHPDLPEGHSLLGELHMAQGNKEKAAEVYRAAIGIEPSWDWARKGLDNALLKSDPEKTASP